MSEDADTLDKKQAEGRLDRCRPKNRALLSSTPLFSDLPANAIEFCAFDEIL